MCYKDEVQLEAARTFDSKTKDIPEFIQNYFVFLTSNESKLTYWSNINQLLEWLINQGIVKHDLYNIATDDLDSITDIHIIKYLDGLKTGLYGVKNALSTINTKKNIYSGFWSYLLENEYVTKNVVTKKVLQKYKPEEKEVTVPTQEEYETLLINVENIKSEIIAIRNIAIIKLFTGTGIRIKELVGLDMDDLYFDEENPYITIMPKGKQEIGRKVPVSSSAIEAVNDYIKLRNMLSDIEGVKALFISEKFDPITNKRKRISPKGISDFFEKYSNKTIHPHMLRHYVGTMMHNSGCDIVVIAEQLGHESVNTTRKSYVVANKSAAYTALNSF